ncbi:MAG: hypothetical protein M3N53_13025 [Actinomycetota bacterium]|nr:hypothetical protein [Actinomycetota bacterium]
MARRDGFFIEKAIGVGLVAAVIGLLLTAPVFCVSQSDRATRCDGLIPVASSWAGSVAAAIVLGILVSAGYFVVKRPLD